MDWIYLYVALVVILPSTALYRDPHCQNKQVIVHLFEWKWTDIATECERFLSKKGFCGVQISPPHEHLLETNPPHPWWDRYQPVSYKLTSRSGTEQQLIDMVHRCNQVGVRIYADVLLNHMANSDKGGNGSAGSPFNGFDLDFPAVPYSREHFTPRSKCPSADGSISDYGNARNVRNCYLGRLTDLDQSVEYVKQKLVGYLDRLVEIGIAGFRLDAAKHMWPSDVVEIMSRVKDLPFGGRPFVYSEVIDNGGEAVRATEYLDIGYVTEFRYCSRIALAVKNFNNFNSFFDPRSEMLDTGHALIFVDNHDNQRGHGSGGNILMHENPSQYKLGVAFTLAYDYGFTRIMSSYHFNSTDQGPPFNDDVTVKDVEIADDGSCGNGWVCEHRWSQIANLVEFRNKMAGLPVQHFQATDDYVSFSRGQKGFFVMSKSGQMNQSFYTGMPEGSYCDVVSGCSRKVKVGPGGKVRVQMESGDGPIMAIMVDDTKDCDTKYTNSILPSLPSKWKRTAILINVQTAFGQNVFLRGGIDHEKRNGCTDKAETSQCAIPIRHEQKDPSSSVYANYNKWSKGDNFIDWYGRERRQSDEVNGTPLIWSTNDKTNIGYNSLNTYGDHFWLLDVSMDCSATYNGWFEFKILKNDQWEGDVHQVYSLGVQTTVPYTSSNHLAMCGYLNVYSWGLSSCTIKHFPNS